MIKDELIAKIKKHQAKVGIVGLGYVGLPLVLRFGEEHFSVVGFDIDTTKVRRLMAGQQINPLNPGLPPFLPLPAMPVPGRFS